MARPTASSAAALRRMRSQRRRNTRPEVQLRQRLHAHGLRFNIDRMLTPGSRRRVDIVFPRLRIAVFVDGCFWHLCPAHATMPRSNGAWWRHKLRTNAERDRRTTADLEADGWIVLRFWEHEDPDIAAERVAATVAAQRACTASSVQRASRS